MTELVFTAGEKNTFDINQDGIHVEFNAGNPVEFNSMALGLGRTVMQLQLGCEQQVGEFFHSLTANNELWTQDGRWAGKPFEKRYAL